FVDKVVDETLPEYDAAAEALNDANADAEAAKKKLDKVAGTIKKFAAAIDKLAALAAKVAPASHRDRAGRRHAGATAPLDARAPGLSAGEDLVAKGLHPEGCIVGPPDHRPGLTD